MAKRSRPEEVFHSHKNTCPLQPYAIKITSPLFSSCINCGHFVRVSLDRELDIHDTHACTNTHKVHREEKNEKQRKKVIKISGRHWRSERAAAAAEAQASPATGLISMKMSLLLPWLPYGCHDTLVALRTWSYRAAHECKHECEELSAAVF